MKIHNPLTFMEIFYGMRHIQHTGIICKKFCAIALLRYVKYTQLSQLNLIKGGKGKHFLVLPVIHNKPWVIFCFGK